MGTHPVDDRKRDKQQSIFESLNNCTINLCIRCYSSLYVICDYFSWLVAYCY